MRACLSRFFDAIDEKVCKDEATCARAVSREKCRSSSRYILVYILPQMEQWVHKYAKCSLSHITSEQPGEWFLRQKRFSSRLHKLHVRQNEMRLDIIKTFALWFGCIVLLYCCANIDLPNRQGLSDSSYMQSVRAFLERIVRCNTNTDPQDIATV